MKEPFRILWILLMITLSGCSAQDWTAKFYMFQAESAVDKATNLKSKKIAFEDRKVYYIKACEYFAKAYEKDSSVYTLTRIEMAADTCWKAGAQDQELMFQEFEKEYIEKHPQEYEHGDSGVGMMEMG